MTKVKKAGASVSRSTGKSSTQVDGKGRPEIDVPAVQYAVDHYSGVYLSGQFDFGRISERTPGTPPAGTSVILDQSVAIFGEDATIMGGYFPFDVNAKGGRVVIQGVTFESPTGAAIQVEAADGLLISDCVILAVRPAPVTGIPVITADGIALGAIPPATLSPDTIVGDIQIVNNTINMKGTDSEYHLGIYVNLGAVPGAVPTREAYIRINGNQIDGVSRHGIDVRNIAGQASIVGNPLVRVAVGAQPQGVTGDLFVNGIRCVGLGRFLVADNQIVCDYANGAGVRLQGGKDSVGGPIPIKGAVVINNTITMSQDAPGPRDNENAGVELRRACESNWVIENVVNGTARAALSLAAETGHPQKANTLVPRVIPPPDPKAVFTPTLNGGEVSISGDVADTTIIGTLRSMIGQGTGTVLVPR